MRERKYKEMPTYLWPPKNSVEEEYVVYRLTREEKSISSNDFKSVYEIDKERNKVKNDLLDDDQYYALSVFDDIDDANALKKKMPYKFKDICKGKTMVGEGCVRLDPSRTGASHRSWWLYENANPIKYFNLVEVKDGE